MKRILSVIFACFILFLSGCSAMESVVPENRDSMNRFRDHEEAYRTAVEVLVTYSDPFLIARAEEYPPATGEESVGEGYYFQNMRDQSVAPYEENSVEKLFFAAGVKLIDGVTNGEEKVISFDLCLPGKNYDYGFYYSSEDRPVYLGDLSAPLRQSDAGFAFDQKASYGSKFTFYTEKICDCYYYYEIM